MALGRISGPLLKSNLIRNSSNVEDTGFDLAFETNLLYLKVKTHYADVVSDPSPENYPLWSGRIGIKTTDPQYDVDVFGTLRAKKLITPDIDIGELNIANDPILSTMSVITNPVGDIKIKAAEFGKVIIEPELLVNDTITTTTINADNGNFELINTVDINVTGTLTVYQQDITNTDNLSVTNSIIYLGVGNPGNILDIGFMGYYTENSIVERTGLIRDATDEIWKLYDNILTDPETNIVDFTDATYADLQVGNLISTNLTPGRVVLVGSNQELADSPNLTFDGSLLSVTGNVDVTGNITLGGNIIIGDQEIDSITVNADFSSSLIPDDSNLYDLGSSTKKWKNLYVDISDIGNINISGNTVSTTNVDGNLTLNPNGIGKVIVDSDLDVNGNITLTGDIFIGDDNLVDTITVNADFSSDLIPSEPNLYDLGSSVDFWKDIYASKISVGSINVTDKTINPLGTSPVVKNVLYVTVDGSDTNDGSAMDASRACRTITGALQSPLYGPGTSIKVAPGRYLEDNPLILKPYTSIIGSDLRTTSIEPINKTQDLFHVDSSCYIAQMQFYNGRSGIIDPFRDRGAYSIAFKVPAENNGDKITIYKSPYIQNCTNQSGPWLYDGTMFVPNQTVQVPEAVATATFDDSQNSINVSVTEGTILEGMSINTAPQDQGFFSARTLLLANKQFVQEQIIQYITNQIAAASVGSIWYNFTYQKEKCYRDVGIIIENILYDSTFGGNSKSVEAGLAYFDGVVSLISGETDQTIAALNYIKILVPDLITNTSTIDLISGGNFQQVINTALTGGNIAQTPILNNIDIIKNIIQNGPSSAPAIYYSTGVEFGTVSAEVLMEANRAFLQKEISAYVDVTFPGFVYNKSKCERDVGLIVDAISQDILLGGNSKTIDAAVTYYKGNVLLIDGEVNETLAALDRLKLVLTLIVQNQNITKTTGNLLNQITNAYFSRGLIAIPSIERNIDTIKDIIENGPIVAPTRYSGSGLFAATGVSADEVQIATKVLDVQLISGNNYSVTLDKPTVGIGNNSTLYFGYTEVYPKVDSNIPERWANRRVDPWGSVGGMLVDGNDISDISPITSMVMDAYTQVNQGGRGIRVTNSGYAQLVSVFTIFCSIAVQVDNGGICSITNSNSNFGDYCLVSKGYSKREFYGTIYNPALLPLYPRGIYPRNSTIAVYVPDTNFRPHIALVMEVEPPDTYVNTQGKPGFLSSTINLGIITEGTLAITGVDVSGISIGQTVYIRDQFGRYNDPITGKPYVLEGTIVSDLSYQTIYLNKPINVTAQDPTNTTVINEQYFTLFTAGNAYYTILNSVPLDRPVTRSDGSELLLGGLILPQRGDDSNTQGEGEVAALNYLKTLMTYVIQNVQYPGATLAQTLIEKQVIVTQVINLSYAGGAISVTRVEELMDLIKTILIDNGNNLTDLARNEIIDNIIKKDPAQVSQGSGSASKLLLANIDFFIAEIVAFLELTYGRDFTFDNSKCIRDVEFITRNISDDLLEGGNYNASLAGLSYYSRTGTHHLVTLEDNITDAGLIPDGAFINFYQRSYMSASGYLFEYVGSGSNYGALPQVGRADPIQSREVIQLDGGKVFFTSTDQNGDFRIGTGLVISQATGILSGRTFQKSLFANMTPFILALE